MIFNKSPETEYKSLYPTFGSIKEVIDFAESKLPITDKNEMFSILMTFQNTLLIHIKGI